MNDLSAFTPLLVGLQTNPERDTRLSTLAAEHGLSPSHFHQRFTEATGETPRAHVDRMRLERAAYRLAVTRESVLSIALGVGFQNHETFSRAFKRRFGRTPAAWRKASEDAWQERLATVAPVKGDGCELSETTFLTLKPLTLLAMRRIGPYGTFGAPRFDGAASEWSTLLGAARDLDLPYRPIGLVISYDNPYLTPPHLQQLDACVPLLKADGAPQDGAVRRIEFDGGLFGAIEHRGPPATLIQGYVALVDGIGRSTRFRMRDGPPLEILRELSPDGDPMKALTEIYLPVEPIR